MVLKTWKKIWQIIDVYIIYNIRTATQPTQSVPMDDTVQINGTRSSGKLRCFVMTAHSISSALPNVYRGPDRLDILYRHTHCTVMHWPINESSEVCGIIKPGQRVTLNRSHAVNVHKLPAGGHKLFACGGRYKQASTTPPLFTKLALRTD